MNTVRFLALFSFACIASLHAQDVALVAAGKANACIVIGAQATEVERFAAQELQDYVSAITKGVQLPMQSRDQPRADAGYNILIGRPETNPAVASLCFEQHIALDEALLGQDGYVVRSVKARDGRTSLLLTGSHSRSALFAVYHLLETWGVRFFGYRWREGEIIPHLATLSVPSLNIVEKPAMRYRFVSDNNFSAADKTKLLNVADWAAKNRCNAFMLTPSRPGESWDQIALDEVRKRGLMIVGPGHVLARFTPDVSLFATHPEYFPLLKGKRDPVNSEVWGGPAAFCWSNTEAMQIVVDRAVKYLSEAPFLDVFAIYPPDGSQRGVRCQCKRCAQLSMSDWYLTLMNHIARAATTTRPDQKVMWIAYNECGVPPAQVQPWQKGKNFVLLWCNDLRDFQSPMDSDANRHAAKYLEWKPRLKTIKTNGVKNPGDTDLAAWHRWQRWSSYLKTAGYAGDVVMLDYYNAHVGKSLRVPMLEYCQTGPWPEGVLANDFQYYTAQGIAGWQNCTDYYNDTPTPYWNWLGAQLMWNPHAEVQALDRDFYSQLYGPAGDVMQRYFPGLWQSMVQPETNPRAKKDLEAAEAIARAADRPDIVEKIKAAGVFQDHCAEIDRARQTAP